MAKTFINMAEMIALRHFAKENGHYWKKALRDSWEKACMDLPEVVGEVNYRQVLQHLRNNPDFGPRGLANFQFGKT